MCAFLWNEQDIFLHLYNIDTSKHKLGMAALMIVWWHELRINKY